LPFPLQFIGHDACEQSAFKNPGKHLHFPVSVLHSPWPEHEFGHCFFSHAMPVKPLVQMQIPDEQRPRPMHFLWHTRFEQE
jgi:hypothetical protein